MTPRRLSSVALLALLAGGPAAARDPLPLGPAPILGICWARPSPEAAVERFHRMAGLGNALVLTDPIPWGWVEPRAPQNRRPTYDWSGLDQLVRSWQSAGLEVVPVLTTGSPWACIAAEETDWARAVRRELSPSEADLILRESPGATPPRPDAWKEWERYVEELVERYDGDGILDMPGLERPVRWFQVLDRAQSPARWMGSADEYLRLLHHAEEGAHRSSESARVVHYAVDLRRLGNPAAFDPADLSRRRERLVADLPAPLALEQRRALQFQDRTLEMPRLFQVVPHVGSANLTDEEADLRALRELLTARSASGVEVWLVESPARKLDPPDRLLPDPRLSPPGESALRREALTAAQHPDRSRHLAAAAWLQRGVAYDLVRTATSALLAGASRAVVVGAGGEGPAEDFVHADPGGRWSRSPSWFAARQWIGLIEGYRGVEELRIGSAGRAVLFRFPPRKGYPWLVVVLAPSAESWAGPLEGESPSVSVSLPLPTGEYRIEATALDEGGAAPGKVEAADRILRVPLGPAPLYVVPVRVEGDPTER